MAGKKGRSGGRRIPASMKLVRGTFQECRDGSRTAAEEAKRAAKSDPIPSAPSFLVRAAKEEWRRVAPILHTRGLLRSREDRAAFTGYCQAWGELVEAEKGIAAERVNAQRLLTNAPSASLVHGSPTYDPALARAVAEARRIVQYAGRVVPGKSGWVRNPAVVIANQAAKRIREFCIEFGMSPSSQNRLEFSRGESEDGVEEFRGRHPKAQPA